MELSNYQLVITALVPIAVALVAGILRQNRLPNLANEAISYALVLALSALNAYLDGKLVGINPFSAFLIIVAYSAASVNTAPYQALQGWLQANIFTLGGKISKPGPGGAPVVDQSALAQLIASELQRNAPAIVALLGDEINKFLARQVAARGSVVPPRASAVTQAFTPVGTTPTALTVTSASGGQWINTSAPAPVRTSTPPGAGVMAHQQVESGASSTSGPIPLIPLALSGPIPLAPADVAKLPTQSVPAVKPPVQG